jgi:uncharacterized protein (DUF58 family)
MTARGAALLLAPLPIMAAGAAAPWLYPAGAALLLLAVLTVFVDSRRAPSGRRLGAHRRHDSILSAGAANPVVVDVGVTGRGAVARVRDEAPPDVRATDSECRGSLPVRLEYAVVPGRRGEVEFGRTAVRAEGPWRLGWRQVSVGEAERVRVDADINAVRAYEALARRGQLEELGLRSLRASAEGSEFERVREATPDDPPRVINWHATARTGRLMATQLVPERAQPVVVCLDHGRLMGVGAGDLTKLDHAINAALLLVHVALRSGDRAGCLGFADAVTVALAPLAGSSQLRRFLDTVRPLRPADTEADYDVALTFYSRWQARRSLAVIFTDVLDLDQSRALIRQCARLSRRHVPLVVTVRDPALDDAARRRPRRGEEAYARAVADGLLADREDTLRVLRRSGVETIDADARTLSPALVNRYLELKRRARV